VNEDPVRSDVAPDPTDQRNFDETMAWLNERRLANDVGMMCVELERGRAVVEWDAPDEWRNPNGSLPGAMLACLADHSAGFAAVSVTGRTDYTATVDLSLRFLRPAFGSPIRAESTVIRRGLRLVFLRTEMSEPDGTLVCDGAASFFVESGLGQAHPIGWDG
jgi:uncharacterized protein (TIGR00369 family)